MDLSDLVAPWIEIGRRLHASGTLGGGHGSVSQRFPEGTRISDREVLRPGAWIITGRHAHEGTLTPDDFTVLGPDRFLLAGPEPAIEWRMHETIYRIRSDVHAIIHAHPPYASALALAGIALPEDALLELAVALKGLPLVPYATPGTEEVGEVLETRLGSGWAALLEHHGAITLGATPHDAASRMETLERGAQTWVIARLILGAVPRSLNRAQVNAARIALDKDPS